jgi:origin recognition complex subunit 2
MEEKVVALVESNKDVGQPPPQRQVPSSSTMSLYPGIRDRVALKVLQCTYRFQDHQFLGLQWKALQNADWTYDSRNGRYQSPSRSSTCAFESANAVQEFLDQFGIPMIHSDLQQPPPSMLFRKRMRTPKNDEEDKDHSEDASPSVEHGKELRNQVCYHMQLLLEKSQRERSSDDDDDDNPNNIDADKSKQPSSISATAATHTTEQSTETNSHTKTISNNITMSDNLRNNRRRSTRNTTANITTATTITATDKGSNLYLHKKQQKPVSAATQRSKKSNHLYNTHASDPTNDDDDFFESPRMFSSREQCIERIKQQMDTDLVVTDDDPHHHPSTVVQEMEAWYRTECFADWAFQLSTNHSLLFYGNGSKYELLNQFGDMELSQHGTVLKLDGFAPEITIERILDVLVDVFLDRTEPEPTEFLDYGNKENDDKLLNNAILEPHSTIVERARNIAKALARHCANTLEPIYLILHNIDGPNLCTDVAQEALVALVVNGIPERGHVAAIRFVASMDHVGASSTLWAPFTNFHFRWLWKEVHTHRPYVQELIMLPDEEITNKNSRASRNKKNSRTLEQKTGRIMQVLRNLAPRHGEVMQVLAKLQIKVLNQRQQQVPETNTISPTVEISSTPWVDYKIFRAECKKNFLIDKDAKLRLLLTELKDHQMLQTHYEGASEYVCIPYTLEKLQEILAMPSRSMNNK